MNQPITNQPRQKQIRKILRNNTTPWEHKLGQHLKGRQLVGFKFQRQHGIQNYIVDFCYPQVKLVVEIDGSGHLHHRNRKSDLKREIELKQWEYVVVRYININIDIEENIGSVLEDIARHCKILVRQKS